MSSQDLYKRSRLTCRINNNSIISTVVKSESPQFLRKTNMNASQFAFAVKDGFLRFNQTYQDSYVFWISVFFAAAFVFKQFLTSTIQFYHCKETVPIQFKSPLSQQINSITLHDLVKDSCPSLKSPMVSHPLLWSGHIQTLWASLYADYFASSKLEFIREIVQTPDLGAVGLDFTKLPSDNPMERKTPYLFILHGLTGGSHETYIQDMIIAAKEYGYESVVMHFRGCNNTPVQSAQLYSGSWTEDVQTCVDYILKKDPKITMVAVGFSLGSNVLVKYAGQKGADCPFIGVVSVGNPYDFLGSLRALHRSFIGKRLYSTHMGKNLIRIFKKHHNIFKDAEWLDIKQIDEATNIMEIDAAATSKQFGYATVHEYYRFGSCAQDIPYIKVPSLFLSALDDPICSYETIPYFEINSNPHTVLITTTFGGHLGWYALFLIKVSSGLG